MTDAFLQEQLELLRRLNERVDKIKEDVNHNVELIEQNQRDVERWRREERVFRERNPENDRRGSGPHRSDDSPPKPRGRHGRPHRN